VSPKVENALRHHRRTANGILKLAAFGRRGKRHGAAAIENRRSVAKTLPAQIAMTAQKTMDRAEVTRLLLISMDTHS
jgi:hypothetical protein